MTVEADFSGYATRNDLRCSDGRTITRGAFEENDGAEVPLLWMHGHDDPTNVLGHVKLENVEDGVKAHAFFNKTAKAQHAKEMVRNGDVKFLSIFANQLIERAKQVLKGNIREVSLVLAGANPGATIENVAFAHSDGVVEVDNSEAYLTTGIEVVVSEDEPELALAHAASTATEGTETLQDILDTLTPKQETAVNFLLSQALSAGSDSVQHSDTDGDEVVVTGTEGDDEVEGSEEEADAEEVEETEEAEAVEDESDGTEGAEEVEESDAEEAEETEETEEATEGTEEVTTDTENTENEAGDDAVQHDNINQEDNSMTHNLFDQAKQGGAAAPHERKYLAHDDMKAVINDTLKKGSLKTALEDYALQHGIENIEFLFPDAKLLEQSPSYLARRVEWVDKVLSSVRRTPFSRIKTVHADITADEARARGYIKGNLKNEEFFKLIKRSTTPQTVYKKQKLDRDDVLDITDLDVVAWMKSEMKLMLSEEIAGAILIGDGRSNGDEDKINEDNIRPIATDDELYTSGVNVNLDDASSSIEELIDAVIANRKLYKGTGTPTFYTSEDIIAAFLTVKDGFGHRTYKTLDDVAQAIRVSEIVPVEVFTRQPDLVGLMVNLVDYSIGTDRGGEATMFDDFDLDYNKLRYLLETRICGALTIPKAAIAFWKVAGTTVMLAEPEAPTFEDNTVTVPTVTHVTYEDGDGNTLATGSPVTLSAGDTLHVVAIADSGYSFPTNVNDEWDYAYQA